MASASLTALCPHRLPLQEGPHAPHASVCDLIAEIREAVVQQHFARRQLLHGLCDCTPTKRRRAGSDSSSSCSIPSLGTLWQLHQQSLILLSDFVQHVSQPELAQLVACVEDGLLPTDGKDHRPLFAGADAVHPGVPAPSATIIRPLIPREQHLGPETWTLDGSMEAVGRS